MTATRPPARAPKIYDFVADLGGEGVAFSSSGKDQTAFQRANDVITGGEYVYFRPGAYMGHEIPINAAGRYLGDGTSNTIVYYNGAGGPGSCLFDIDVPSSGNPAIEIAGFRLYGFDQGAHQIAENILRYASGTPIDFGHKIHNLDFAYCFGDAIYQPNGFVNWFMSDMRFDSVGGYCINVIGNPASNRRPFHLQDFTMQNNITGTFQTAATNEGYYDGTHWGKGVLRTQDCVDSTFAITNARLEFTKRLIVNESGRCAAFLIRSPSGNFTTLELDSVIGFTDNLADALMMVHDPDGKAIVSFKGMPSGISGSTMMLETAAGTGGSGNVSVGALEATSFQSETALSVQGHIFNGHLVEWRAALPTFDSWYQQGDIIFNQDAAASGFVGWVCVTPTVGRGNPANPTRTTTAVVTSGSPIITVPAALMHLFPVGNCLDILGAGPAGATLQTRTIDVNITNHTITVANNPSTSVGAATIKETVATFKTFGAITA